MAEGGEGEDDTSFLRTVRFKTQKYFFMISGHANLRQCTDFVMNILLHSFILLNVGELIFKFPSIFGLASLCTSPIADLLWV